MSVTAEILNSFVPISQFNRGQASKIFERVKTEKQIVVVKNNRPEAVIISLEEYLRLLEIEEDQILLAEAEKRVKENGDEPTIPESVVLEELGITQSDIDEMEDLDIE